MPKAIRLTIRFNDNSRIRFTDVFYVCMADGKLQIGRMYTRHNRKFSKELEYDVRKIRYLVAD